MGVGINDPAYRRAERKERYHLPPMSAPALRNGWIFPAPWPGLKGFQAGQVSFGIFGAVDAAQRPCDRFPVLPGRKPHGIADQVYNAGLHHGLRKYRVDRLRKSPETINNRNQDIGDTPVPELVHDAHPELCPIGLFDPDADDFLGSIWQNAKRNIDRLVADKALIADLHPDRIEEYQRVAGIKRPALPFSNRLQHGVGDCRNQVR